MAADRPMPTGRVRRAARAAEALAPGTARLLGALAARAGRSPERAEEALSRRHEELADRAVELLGSLRGGAMKVGQLMSFLDPGVLPPEYRAIYEERLATLRDAAPPMSFERVRAVLETEWGEPVERLFEGFDERAAAAASIGQVHRATLRDGRSVAVKVQYPEIADALAADVETAGLLMHMAKAVAPGLDRALVARELRERLLEEADYELEATNQRTFARAYRGHPFIFVPPVVTELSRRRVLVAEWADGRGFADVLELAPAERDRFAEIVFRFGFGSMYRLGAYNTDPHPGNYLLRADGTVAFLDFGSVKHVNVARLRGTALMLLAAARGDGSELVRRLDELGARRPGAPGPPERWLDYWRAVAGWLIEDRDVTVDRAHVASVIATSSAPETLRLLREASVPPDEVMYRRLELGLLAVFGRLGATRNWHRILREWWLGEGPATALGDAERDFWRSRGRAAALLDAAPLPIA